MTAIQSLDAISELATQLQPIQRLEAVERILGAMDLSNPGLAEIYERIADVEAATVASAVDDGEIELQDADTVLASLRQRYAG